MSRVTSRISISLDGFVAGPTENWRRQHGMEGGEKGPDDGIGSAFEPARAAAEGEDVQIAGGASAIRQYLAAGLLDELQLHIVPIVLGAGERLLENLGDPALEPIDVVASPAATHVKYRVS